MSRLKDLQAEYDCRARALTAAMNAKKEDEVAALTEEFRDVERRYTRQLEFERSVDAMRAEEQARFDTIQELKDRIAKLETQVGALRSVNEVPRV